MLIVRLQVPEVAIGQAFLTIALPARFCQVGILLMLDAQLLQALHRDCE
jgi:hypothetical protein